MEPVLAIELDGQYRALRESAGLLARPDRRTFGVTGAEAAEYLQGQLTNDIEALAPGEGTYAALLDRKGRIQGDMRVLRLDEELRLETEATAGDAVLRHLSMYKIGRDVEVEEISNRVTVISVIGPAAAHLALAGPLAPEHAHRAVEIGHTAALAVATDLGLDLIVARDEVDAVAEALTAAGIEPVSEAAAEIVRVESGRPRFGYEMTTATMPAEAEINDRAVSFTKGCYIGQETVARLHYKGRPNRRLRGLRLSAPATAGDPIRLGEREVGTVGTAVVSPAHGPLALAIVRREAEADSTVEVGDAATATIVELPF
jgi:folate-binding protein YgfZ